MRPLVLLGLWLLVACTPQPITQPTAQGVAPSPRVQATFPPTWTPEPATPTSSPAPTGTPAPTSTPRPPLDQHGDLAEGETQQIIYRLVRSEEIFVFVEPDPTLNVILNVAWDYGEERAGRGFRLLAQRFQGEPEGVVLEANPIIKAYEISISASQTTSGAYRLRVMGLESSPDILWHETRAIPPQGETQRYEFSAAAGQPLRLWWYHRLRLLDKLTLTLTGPDGEVVKRMESEEAHLRWLDFTPPTSGTYALQVEGTQVTMSVGELQVLFILRDP